MSLKNLIKEIEQESISTQKVLARLPADKFDWKPHEKSMTLKSWLMYILPAPDLL